MGNMKESTPLIFCVSLASELERRNHSIRTLAGLGIPYEIVDAIDGRRGWGDMPHTPGWGVALRPEEGGCYHSHLKALARIIELGLPYGLVVEDDFTVLPARGIGLADVCEEADGRLMRWDHIQLHGMARDWEGIGYARLYDSGPFHRVRKTTLMTPGYAISARLAERVLAEHRVMTMPIDHLYASMSASEAFSFYDLERPLVGVRGVPSIIQGEAT